VSWIILEIRKGGIRSRGSIITMMKEITRNLVNVSYYESHFGKLCTTIGFAIQYALAKGRSREMDLILETREKA